MYPRMDGHAEEMLLVMERVNSVENYLGEERGGIRLNLGRGRKTWNFGFIRAIEICARTRDRFRLITNWNSF